MASGENENGYRQGQMAFREWLPTYEREQEHHSNQIAGLISAHSQLSAEVATISANVQTMLQNQKSFTDRMNRPWQWGVVIASFMALFSMGGIFATILTLTVNPMKAAIEETNLAHKSERTNQMEINMWMREIIEKNQIISERNNVGIRNLEKQEERYNNAYGLSSRVYHDEGRD